MKSRTQKSPYKPTLVKSRLVEITDPAEIAALEKRIRAAEKAMAEREKAIAASEGEGTQAQVGRLRRTGATSVAVAATAECPL